MTDNVLPLRRPASPVPFALRHMVLIKSVVWLLALLPALRLAIGVFLALDPAGTQSSFLSALGKDLGSNPLETLTRTTGFTALCLICLGLAVTPLRQWLSQAWLIRLRRLLGLFAFFYVVLHALCWVWFDHFFDPVAMARDVLKRPFITLGFAAFVLLLPLALTSTNAAMRRLGGKRWQLLHRLVYVAAPVSAAHFWWMKAGKNDLAQPAVFALVLVLLGAARIIWKRRQRPARTGPTDWIQVRRTH